MGKGRAPCCDKSKVKKGPWTSAEDLKLVTFIRNHGHSNWRALPSQAGLLRCGKSCRLRWINYLRPDVKRGNFTPEEEEIVIKLHQECGNKWSKIASFLPGRTDNEIKNIWNTHLKKRLGIRSNKRKTSKKTKSKKTSKAAIVESTSPKSFSALLQSDQVDRDSKVRTSHVNKASNSEASTTPEHSEHNESRGPILISCTNDQSIHTDMTFDTTLEGMNIDDLGALDELQFQIPIEFEQLDYWNLLELDNLCSLQTAKIDDYPCNALEESSSIDFEDNHTCTDDNMTQTWVRNLEIELGLDDMD